MRRARFRPPAAYTVPVDVGDRRTRVDSTSIPFLWLLAVFLGALELGWWVFWHVLTAG
jgi:hypothetical protein